jgi:hypothetical protein
MRNVPATFMIWGILSVLLVAVCSGQTKTTADKSIKVSYFDVLDLPARIDEPRLLQNGAGYSLTCAMANRSAEQLLGAEFILLIIDRDGKTRARINWSEESQLVAASIKTFEFHPPVKDSPHPGDRLFLSIDVVIGRDTIWHAIDSEKALRGYAHGQNDVAPKVRTAANKDDRQPTRLIPLPRKQ